MIEFNAHHHGPVYPRVGGGTSTGLVVAVCRTRSIPAWAGEPGLSPRGRGNHLARNRIGWCTGSIPAWAGEPFRASTAQSCARVYPRVGGGTAGCQLTHASSVVGLSPRGRGNHYLDFVAVDSIQVYPRVGGGTLSANQAHTVPDGSIPAWAGEPIASRSIPASRDSTCGLQPGLSPRGRGNPWPSRNAPFNVRSIPAWAGEPHRLPFGMAPFPVYPRVGGGTDLFEQPRTRPRRSIPAWAGEPRLVRAGSCVVLTVYPRVGGGTPITVQDDSGLPGLSPRGRGNRLCPSA